MEERWQRTTVQDNRGEPLEVWALADAYELARELNLGNEGGWVYELKLKGKRVGTFVTLAEGKAAGLAAIRVVEEPAEEPAWPNRETEEFV